jgi:hypothetical protein
MKKYTEIREFQEKHGETECPLCDHLKKDAKR